jgi:hypothetical protein
MLRKVLIWIGALLLAFGAGISLASHSLAGLGPFGLGTVLLLAILFERRGYKRIEEYPPGPDWQPTGEQFRDPGSDEPVAVYFQPSTGKRAYVRRPGAAAGGGADTGRF